MRVCVCVSVCVCVCVCVCEWYHKVHVCHVLTANKGFHSLPIGISVIHYHNWLMWSYTQECTESLITTTIRN